MTILLISRSIVIYSLLVFFCLNLAGIIVLFYLQLKRRKTLALHSTLANQVLEISSYQKNLPYIAKEISRARRYRHPLSVIAIELETEPLPLRNTSLRDPERKRKLSEMYLMHTDQLDFILLGAILRDSLRESDMVTFDGKTNKFYLILPETSQKEAKAALHRLNSLVFQQTSLTRLRQGISTFPENGIIAEDLFSSAGQNCKSVSLPEKKYFYLSHADQESITAKEEK
ncbi:hypothetical protein GF407_18905 [candidate division KSB1 bacterium]|nr:hypothetical protein [candidate division KSB1 bacterium]